MPRNRSGAIDSKAIPVGRAVLEAAANVVERVVSGASRAGEIRAAMETIRERAARNRLFKIVHETVKHHALIAFLVSERSRELAAPQASGTGHATRMVACTWILEPLLDSNAPVVPPGDIMTCLGPRTRSIVARGVMDEDHAFLEGFPSTVHRHAALLDRRRLPRDPATLAIATSHPSFFIETLAGLVSRARLERILLAHQAGERFFMQARPGKDAWLASYLRSKSFTFHPDPSIAGLVHVMNVPGWKRHLVELDEPGTWLIQDRGSAAVIEALDVGHGDVVLDACAAPLQKTLHLSWLAGPRGLVVAMDASPGRLGENIDRFRRDAGSPASILAGDAIRLDATFRGLVPDKVLVDAPCSGSGSIGAYPELKWMQDPATVARHARLQAAILRSCIDAARAGSWHGTTFVYSTCSYYPAEGEAVIDAVQDDIVLHDLHAGGPLAGFPPGWKGYRCARKVVRTFPDVQDGARAFFMARFTVRT